MSLQARAENFFTHRFGGEATTVARAPGRIEIIGNHTDYNCGTVMGAAIDRGVVVAARLRNDGRYVFASEDGNRFAETSGRPFVRQQGSESWINYPLGVIVALEQLGMPSLPGVEMAVVSDLPPGAGLSSSAAIELAVAFALCDLQRFSVPLEKKVGAGRAAENDFVGVPCGILDQGVSGFGCRDHFVQIDCRGPVFSTVRIPASVRFWIFNTHKKHALIDSLYAARHAECMEAAKRLGDRFAGVRCLADVRPEQLPDAREVLSAVLFRRARHVVEEIDRVGRMQATLARGDLSASGALLYASHESSRALFENSTPELDLLVDVLRDRDDVYGARLTGGGFGGAVLAMTDERFNQSSAGAVIAAYARRTDERPDVIQCSTADGARVLRGQR